MSSDATAAVVSFDDVSKHYRLGSVRKGLRETIAGAIQALVGQGDEDEGRVIKALDHLTFSLSRGRSLGIVGPNGSGKTTVLKILSRITSPTLGQVRWKGRVAGLIELGAGFHPDLTGKENLFLNAAILGMSQREARDRYQDIVAFAELERFMDTPVKRYSSGMYVRLAFAVAAHVQPDLLLVDEVLAVGDASFQQKCVERIRRLRDQGTTLLFVSHNLNLLRSVCDEGLFLLAGRTAAFASTMEVIREYERYLASSEANRAATLNATHFCLESYHPEIRIGPVRMSKGNRILRHDSDLVLDVPVDAGVDLAGANVLVRVIRSDGAACCEFRSSDYEQRLPALRGKGSLTLRFEPVQLASGVYLVEVRLQDSSDTVTLALTQSDWFQVIGPGVSQSSDSSGVFIPRLHWEARASSDRGSDDCQKA